MLSTLIAILWAGGVWGLQNNQKYWIHNTNFENPRNWNLNRVPCDRDRVIFPPELDLGVALPAGKTVLSELVLSRNGELFLPSNGILQIGGGDTAKCRGGDIEFTRTGAEAWLNPGNWRPSPDKEFPAPTPHIDRIPCEDDDVMFDKAASFSIELPSKPISVRNILFGENVMKNAEWQLWLSSEPGYRQFTGREDSRLQSVAIESPATDQCSAKLGCSCINKNPQNVLQAVCSFAKPQCKAPSCYYPVTPLGHCCPFCGSYVTVKYDKAFDISTLRTLVNDYLSQAEYGSILAHAKKTSFEPNTVQIVLINGEEYQENTKKLADILADDILKDMDLGVTKVLVQSAGPAVTGSKLAHAAETMFSTFFVVVLFLATIFYVFVYRRGNLFGAANYGLFRFARFENARDDEAALAIAIDEDMTAESPSKAFDNPMYREVTSGVEELSRENPVYSNLKRREEGEVHEEESKEKEEEEEEEEGEVSEGDLLGAGTFHEIAFDNKE